MERGRLGEVGRVFAWLGATAFGGPAAHVALMRSELVERRRWIDERTFLDLVGVTSLLPGPNSTELAIELGRRRAGGRGLVVAGVAFIAPAAVLVGFLAWAYTRHGGAGWVSDVRSGILPVVVAVIAHATWKLGRTAMRSPITVATAILAACAFLAGIHELVVLGAGAALTALWAYRSRLAGGTAAIIPFAVAGLPTAAAAGADAGLGRLFWSFLRIGALLFGSGYVIVAFLQAEFVDRLGLLTTEQLIDAVTIGQVTPGPVFTTATFVGYVVHGWAGAVIATVAIFVPAFLLVALLGRWIAPALRRPAVRPVIDGLNAASVGLMAGVAVELADDAFADPLSSVVAVAALLVLLLTRLNPSWPIVGGLLIGIARALT